tara:strand:- start:35 stop:271 length:237 start_codon:yes stop_codon:yes gene_type:complete
MDSSLREGNTLNEDLKWLFETESLWEKYAGKIAAISNKEVIYSDTTRDGLMKQLKGDPRKTLIHLFPPTDLEIQYSTI